MTLYLHPDGTLSEVVPDAASMTLDWGYQQWLDGTPPPAWRGGAGTALRIVEANITLFYEAQQATLGGPVRPELTAWWGTDASIPHHVFMDGPDAVTAGQIIEVNSALRLPAGGLVMSPTTSPLVRVGSYYADGPVTGNIDVLMGDDTPSRIDMLVEDVAWPELEAETMLDTSGMVRGGRCAATINPTEEADSYHDLVVDEDLAGFTVRVVGRDAIPTPDIDLVVYSPNGTDVGGGHSSFEVEGADVWWHNIAVDGAGTYRIRVVACTPQEGAYDLLVTGYRHMA